mgnify:CR=1 FL=1
MTNQPLGLKHFTDFYGEENREELIKFISKILDRLRADYTQNYVVYPLPLVDEL